MGFAAPLTRLDTEGRYRELFMELREMRQDGNWLDVNGAFFFEKYLRHRATRLGDDVHIEIRLIPGQDATCAAPRTATITTNTLPRWINDGCQFQLTLGNRSDQPIGLWAALYSHQDNTAPKMILRNHAALPPKQALPCQVLPWTALLNPPKKPCWSWPQCGLILNCCRGLTRCHPPLAQPDK